MNVLQIKQAHVIGHSIGGAIAQQIALLAPERINKLVLINSFSKINHIAYYTILGRLQMAELDIPLHIKIQTNLSWLYSNRALKNAATVKNIFQRINNNPYSQSLTGFKNQVNACVQHDTQKKLSQIKQRTLILYGKQDILINLDHSIELLKIPFSKLRRITGAHMLIIENAFKTSQAVLRFLKEI